MNINYKSDFKVTMTPTISGVPIDVSLHDWDIIFFTHNSVRRYICSKHGDTLTNCHLNEGKIVCVFDNHKLSVGNLLFEFHDYAPDADYPDGNELTVTPSALDVTLVVGAGDGSEASGEVVVDVSAAIANANMAADAARAAAERAEAAADEVDVVIGRASGYADAASESASAAAASAASASSESDEAHGSMVAARNYADNAAASASQVESALVNYYTKSEDDELLAGKADKVAMIDVSGTDVTQELQPNTFYRFGTVDSLTLTLAAAPSGVLAIYACSFVAASASTTLTLPASVVGEAPTITAGSRYELNIMDNVLLYTEHE